MSSTPTTRAPTSRTSWSGFEERWQSKARCGCVRFALQRCVNKHAEAEDEAAEAWRVAPGHYERESPPSCHGERLSSCYVTVRDSTRLAVGVPPPGRDAEEERAYPAVLLFTPYYRRFALRDGHGGRAKQPNLRPATKLLPLRGRSCRRRVRSEAL